MARGLLGLLSVKPQQSAGPDGRMAIGDHLRELRGRLARSALFFLVIFIVSLFFYDQIFEFVLGPYNAARKQLGDVSTEAYISGATGALVIYLKLCGLASLIVSAPFILYQLWAFIVPGLHANEKKWTRIFAAVAGPIFFAGVATGFYVLPKGLEVLIGLTPDGMQNLVEFGEYFSFFSRMLLIFGVAFEIPLFVVMLNLAGVVKGATLGRIRPWLILGTFVFAAVATPSTDPFSMLFLAIPMTVLFLVAEIVARTVDRFRRRKSSSAAYGDDELSPL